MAEQALEQSIKFTTTGADRVVDNLDDIEKAAERADSALRAAEGVWLPDVAKDAERASESVRGLGDDAKYADDQLEKLDGKRVSVTVDTNSDLRKGFDGLDRAGTIGSQVLGGTGASEAANVAGWIGDVATAASTLNPLLIATAAGGTVLGLVLGDIQQRLEAVREAGQEYSDDLLQQIELGQSDLTTREVERMRDDVQSIIDAISADSDELSGLQEDYAGTLSSLTSIQDELNGLTSSGEGSSEQARLLSEELVRASTSLDRLDTQIRDRLNIEDESVNAYAALNAALENNKGRIEEHQGTIDNYNSVLASGDLLINDAREGLNNFFGQLGENVGVVSDLIQDAAATADEQLEAARTSYRLTNQIIDDLQNNVEVGLGEVVAAQNAVARETEAIAASQEKVADAGERATKAQDDYAAAQDKGVKRINEIMAQGNEKLTDLFGDYADRREDAEEDLNDRLDEIEDKRLKSASNAIAERDTLAYNMAEDAAQDESEREEKQARKDEQRDERNYQKQVQQAERANQRLLDAERARQSEELATKRVAAVAALNDLATAQQAENTLRRSHYAQNALESAVAGYQAGKLLLDNFMRAINSASQIRIPGTDWRFGSSGGGGMNQQQVDARIENAFRQVYAR